jgi:hypothetical protein
MPGIIQNPFSSPAFNQAYLTESVNIIPNMYGRLQQLNLMPIKGVSQTTVIVEEMNGVLNLLPQTQRSGPAAKNRRGKRTVRSFIIPQFALEDVVRPEEVQDIRGFNTTAEETAARVLLDKLITLRNKHNITLEYMRCGALQGLIKDGDGNTLYNLFTEFGISEKSVNFAFGTSTTNVRAKCMEVVRHIEDNLKGEVMTGVHCLASPEWFDAFVDHADVRDRYKYAQSNNNLQRDLRRGWDFAGITFEEYRGNADDTSGVNQKFIPANTARFFPVGTQNTFETYAAPADFMETVNTLGQEMYAKQEPLKFNRGTEIHTQSNPLPMCKRPSLLVKATNT